MIYTHNVGKWVGSELWVAPMIIQEFKAIFIEY